MIKQPFKTFRQREKQYSARKLIILIQFLSLRQTLSNFDLQITLLKIACFESKCNLTTSDKIR